jgi:translation initiation factor 1
MINQKVIHIRLQQRNGRKSLTIIQGLDESIDFEKIIKSFKKEFCCNGCIVKDKQLGAVVQLQGDQRENVKNFLIQKEISCEKFITIHGL